MGGERNGYAAGTPCSVDVSTPDMEQTNAFYSDLFGWTASTVSDPQAGGYFMLGDELVAAAGPPQAGGARLHGAPTSPRTTSTPPPPRSRRPAARSWWSR